MKRINGLAVAALVLAASGVARADDPGLDLFNRKCAVCHGKDGKGKTPMGEKLKAADLTDPAKKAKLTQASIEKTVTDGIPEKKMAAFKGKLTEAEIKTVATFALGLK